MSACLQIACVDTVEVDRTERAALLPGSLAPRAEFDPAQRIVPLPNALLMDPTTGRVNVPPGCGEVPGSPAASLRGAINQLDGFGTSRLELVVTFSEPVDTESLEGRVFLLRIAERGLPLQRPERPVPLDLSAGTAQRAAPDCSSSEAVPSLTLRPRVALHGSSTYAVLLTRGIQAVGGQEFEPSSTWALVRQAEPPVHFPTPLDAAGGQGDPTALPDYNATPLDPADPEALESLQGLDVLWRAHAPLLAALDAFAPTLAPAPPPDRADVLLAWAFGTETLGDPLDPTLPGTPAARAVAAADAFSLSWPLAGDDAPLPVPAFFASAIPGVPCEALGCDAIGAIYLQSQLSEAPRFTSTSFLQGDDCSQPAALASNFDDPLKPSRVCERQLPVLLVLPRTPPGPAGYPTLIFGHGLGRSKEDLLAIAGTLARGGFASVAMDALDHGQRAVRVSREPALGCDSAGPDRPCTEEFGPGCAPQCFAPILSPDLARTRDHLRQTVLDQLALEATLLRCAEPGACGPLLVDAQRIGYLGQSLGSLIGGVTVPMSTAVRAAELNVGAGDWVQVLMDTATAALRCPLVDGLIAAGVVIGSPWNLGANPSATCFGEDWKEQAGFLQFAAAARWLLDPVDPINYVDRLASSSGRSVLLAEVVGDAVIPNTATGRLGDALGLQPELAEPALPDSTSPSPAAVAPGSQWLRYPGLAADAHWPGNAYSHGSLLAPAQPAESMAAGSGELGTLRMQLDALGFFATHFGGAE